MEWYSTGIREFIKEAVWAILMEYGETFAV